MTVFRRKDFQVAIVLVVYAAIFVGLIAQNGSKAESFMYAGGFIGAITSVR